MRTRFAPREICAIEEKAHGEVFYTGSVFPTEERDGVAIVNIRGPLMHHADPCFDSYDAIKARVVTALAKRPSAIVMSIDSPGGLVSGCFDTAREIRAVCDAADVPLYSYIDGQAVSAAYAVACVAQRVVIPPTAEAGSIGCIAEIVSVAKLDAAMGVDRRIITSGDRKADGNPNAPISDATEATIRAKVMLLAGLFAQHVAEYRGVSVDEVVAMQAGVVIGAAATPMLADEVMGLDEMLAAIAAGKFASAPAVAATNNETETTMKTNANKGASAQASAEADDKENPYAKARAALQAVVDDEKSDDKAKAKAKAALEAMKDDDGEEAKAAADDEHKEPDGDESPKAVAARALAAVNSLVAERDADREKAVAAQRATDEKERATLIASRPDLDAASKALLASAPLADVRAFVAAAPKRVVKAAATAVVGATRGAGQVDDKSPGAPMAQDSRSARAMRIAMGIEKSEPKVIQNGPQLIIGAMPEHLLEMDDAAAE